MGSLLTNRPGSRGVLRRVEDVAIDLDYMYRAPQIGVSAAGAGSNACFANEATEASPTIGTWTDMVDLAGRGFVPRLAFALVNSSNAADVDLRLQIDGRTVLEKNISTGTSNYLSTNYGCIIGACNIPITAEQSVSPTDPVLFTNNLTFSIYPNSYSFLTFYAFWEHVFTKKVLA